MKRNFVILPFAILLSCLGCSLIDEVAEGWMVLRHYQQLRELDEERKSTNCIGCGAERRDGPDLLCAECRENLPDQAKLSQPTVYGDLPIPGPGESDVDRNSS